MTSAYILNAQQQYILDQFNGQCYEPNRMDVQEGRLWDSVHFIAGAEMRAVNSQLFVNCGYGSNKTQAESNMRQSKRLDAPEAFSIRRVLFTFGRDCDDRDVYSLAERMSWSLMLGNRRYLHSLIISMRPFDNMAAPFRICDFCKAVYVQDIYCPGCGARSFSLSSPSSDAGGKQFQMDLSINIVIDNQCSFCVVFEEFSYVPISDVKLWCHLEGLHARGVC